MVVNLYADHLLQPERNNRIRPPEEIWYATMRRPAYFEHAAKLVGLSHAEFREFQIALLDGKALRVRLPRRVDAIAGDHAGRLYAIENATIGTTHAGWPSAYLVRLADGAHVYVPDSSGSLSLLRPHHERHSASTVVYVQPPDRPVSVHPKHVPVPVGIARIAPDPKRRGGGQWFFGLRLDAALPGYLAGTMR